MIRVASLYLPQLSIERLRRLERPAGPPEPRAGSGPVLPLAVDDDPGACSVPRSGGWRPGARWARDDGLTKGQVAEKVAALPAHQRPPMREMGRRSEPADHPFRAMPPDEGKRATAVAPQPVWGAARATVLIERIGQRDVISSACPAALGLGLTPGMGAAHARALVPDLDVRDADPTGDRAWLGRLALHAVAHWTPTVSASSGDGLWLDLTGTAHLFGGEERFCRRLLGFCARLGFTVRIAIAGTPGTAHALARFGGSRIVRIEPGGEASALADLPLAALRLEQDALIAANRFGFERIADLIRLPRGPLARRLGLKTVARLDQALGHVAEPVVPVIPFDAPTVSRRLLEPIGTGESISQVIADLVEDLILLLQERGLGVRNAVLTADRVDGDTQRIAIGASRATRDGRHLRRMFALKLDRIDPGLGIEAMYLAVPHCEHLGADTIGSLAPAGDGAADLAPAIDQLIGRAGESAVFRMGPNESDVPERAVRRTAPLGIPGAWPGWSRPVRILQRPEQMTNVVTLLPDHAPKRFSWRGKPYRVVAGDGPERIHGEWWRNDRELWAVRDYFRVEVEGGERFWLFRRGDGVDTGTGDLSWYVHGIFG